MKVLIIDNYDSFTFNLYQDVAKIVEDNTSNGIVDVIRNDAQTLEQITAKNYDRIIISPGPGSPDDPAYFGICGDVIKELGAKTPILGVCLGMQGIAYCFGGNIVRATTPMHGRTSKISHNEKDIFEGIPQELEVMRYHSLIVEEGTLPEELEITARDIATNEIMALRHKEFPIQGVQFHPESFASEGGEQLIKNFLDIGSTSRTL
jgi:anthranilate synthase/aminodeoxychorismate synthase-like glutamine amidotransferase